MDTILNNLPLIWLIAGLVLVMAELLIPGGFVLILLGLGALTLSLVTWLIPIGFITQLTLFAIAVLMYTFLLKENLKKILNRKPSLDDPENEFKGKLAIALTEFNNQEGKVEYKGTQWPAKSDYLIQPGEEVEIVEQESIVLHVKPLNK